MGNGYTWNVQFKDVTDDYRNTEDTTVKWAFEATLRDTKSMKDYMEVYEKAKGLFETAEEIIAAVGSPPIWQAVGIFLEAQADQYKDKFFDQKERAKKRAEALAIKKRFSLSYDYGEADYVEEKALTIGFEKEAERINGGENVVEAELIDEYSQEQPTERPYNPGVVKTKLDKWANKFVNREVSLPQRGLMAGMLEACFAVGDAEMKRKEVCHYLTGHGSSKDIPDNYILALLEWIKPQKDSGGAYTPDAYVSEEANKILVTRLKELGQLALLED